MLTCRRHYIDFSESPGKRMLSVKPPGIPDRTSGRCYLLETVRPVVGIHGKCIIETLGEQPKEEIKEKKD